ncbi:hypothetical protein TRFO_32534 [Tritrichomonas foetus]|uniref:Apoptosis inhibitory protein 5 n=1 Tax=Tritrichomonas foetus TaxID=1144522 RepID=A0A1J4JQM1_9EUKA|nr:hypothetical protein TRFO_32534 [Tritrichomonas foetus]|eukprot:OHT00712.1 hypothetical protein TRFO_32534 [Tritrichomonas foetus]
MPPKAAAVTKESVDEAVKRLSESENPSEADFKILLNAAKAGDEEKAIAATYIPSFFDKFSKQQKPALTAVLDLAKSDSIRVRSQAIRNLKKFYEVDKSQIANALFAALGDEDERIVASAIPDVVRLLKSDEEEFRNIFFEGLPNQKPESQRQLVLIVRDEIKFTEENVEQLMNVLNVSFRTCVVEGLQLYRRNRTLIKKEQFEPLAEQLLDRLDNSLQTEFRAVCENLLIPLFKFTKTLGTESTTRLLAIIAKHVIPRFEELSDAANLQISIIRKIADVSRYAEGDEMLKELYNHLFLKIPIAGPVNFSIIEATLFAFIRLAQKSHITASNLIGTVLCYTGQPGEADASNEDAGKRVEFTRRLEYLQTICPDFVTQCIGKIEMYKNSSATTDDEKRERAENIRNAVAAKRTGNNVRHLSRILLSENPLSGKMPKGPSWKRLKQDQKFKGKRGAPGKFNRNDRGSNSRRPNTGRNNSNSNRPSRGFNGNRNNSRFNNNRSNNNNNNRSRPPRRFQRR